MDWVRWLLLASTIVNAMLVGASLDEVIKQLGVRRTHPEELRPAGPYRENGDVIICSD